MLKHRKSVSQVRSSSALTLPNTFNDENADRSAVLGLALMQDNNDQHSERSSRKMKNCVSASCAQTVRTVHASNQIFDLFGLDIEKYSVLATIAESIKPQTSKILEEYLFLPPGRVTSIVSNLQSRNLIERGELGLLTSTKYGALLLASVASVMAMTLNQQGCAQ